MAHKLGTAVPPPRDALPATGNDVTTSMVEASNVTESLGVATDSIPNKMPGVVENATRPDPEQQGTDQLAGKQIAALKSNSPAIGRFSFNPAQLMARDRWSQVWTNFVTPAASGEKPDSLPAEDVKASVAPAASSTVASSLTPVFSSTAAPSIKSAVSPAVNLSQNLLSMEIEKPVKWMRDKAKVSHKTYPNLVPTVFKITNTVTIISANTNRRHPLPLLTGKEFSLRVTDRTSSPLTGIDLATTTFLVVLLSPKFSRLHFPTWQFSSFLNKIILWKYYECKDVSVRRLGWNCTYSTYI